MIWIWILVCKFCCNERAPQRANTKSQVSRGAEDLPLDRDQNKCQYVQPTHATAARGGVRTSTGDDNKRSGDC